MCIIRTYSKAPGILISSIYFSKDCIKSVEEPTTNILNILLPNYHIILGIVTWGSATSTKENI